MNIKPIEDVAGSVSSTLVKMAVGVKSKIILRSIKAYKTKRKFDEAKIIDALNQYPEVKKKSDRKIPAAPLRTELLEF